MTVLDTWSAMTGPWQGTYELRGDPSFDADSASTAIVSVVLGGLFVSIAYTWSESGSPQEGLILMSQEPDTTLVTAVWLDTWHNGFRMMSCEGQELPGGGIDVRGSYPGGPDMPDWGWRTRLEPDEDTWTLTMFNVSPQGEEARAVLVRYERAG